MSEDMVERSSGNVFADLGYADAPTHRLKADLVYRMQVTMERRGVTQTKAAQLMGVGQPEVSRLLRGHFRDISVERLLKMLGRFDLEVEITVRDHGALVGETIHMDAVPT